MADLERDFVHLAKLALSGHQQDVLLLIRRALPGIARSRPELATELGSLVAGSGNPDRAKTVKETIPVDLDSRLELLRLEEHPVMPVEPTWSDAISKELIQICHERSQIERLNAAGVLPTRSMLFVGPPGVGKSLAARYLATQLQRSLLILDLAAVMSSFLGRTGNNIRAVLQFARQQPSILLLDEFDAIAKRRDDSAEIGELKRLVTVLLQAIDDWPPYGILIAATNHPDLLDPAVWRRFERVLSFDLPDFEQARKAIEVALPYQQNMLPKTTVALLSLLLTGQSFADIDRAITTARRESVIRDMPLPQVLDQLNKSLLEKLTHDQRIKLAVSMCKEGFTQREAQSITGVSRDTIRSRSGEESNNK
jgi:SpoVK/Ycf46/Vps4 family AAA+-type ATPase